jgi:hypothetical protein
MSTRGAYVFEYQYNGVCVYRHCDNYPSGAAAAIQAALGYSWSLPRWEIDEFAAAFVAANNPKSGGGIRLISGDRNGWMDFAHDLEFVYRITCKNGKLNVAAFHVFYNDVSWEMEKIYDGELEGLATCEEHKCTLSS